MNKRVDELLWQAGGYTILNYPDDTFLDGRYALTQEHLDEFAKLIIQECISVVIDSDPSPKMILHQPYRTIVNNIEEHFGFDVE